MIKKHVFAIKKEHMTKKEEFRLKIPNFLFFMDVYDNYNKIK
jgi:hypothetical protein